MNINLSFKGIRYIPIAWLMHIFLQVTKTG